MVVESGGTELGREEGIRQQRVGYFKKMGWIHKWPYIVPNVVAAHRHK